MKRLEEQEEALAAFLEAAEAAEAVEEGAREDAVAAMAQRDPSAVKHILGGAKGLVASLRKKAAKTNSPNATINRTAKLRSAPPSIPSDAKPKAAKAPPIPKDAKPKLSRLPPPIPADAKKKPVGEASDIPMVKTVRDSALLAMKKKDPEALKNAMAGGKNLVMALRKKAAKERQSGKSIVNRHATSSSTQVRDPMDRPKIAKAESVEPVIETISKQGNKFVIKSKDGKKRLGEYSTHEQALKRLRQIEFFKNESQDLELFHALGMPKREEYFIDEEIEEDYLD